MSHYQKQEISDDDEHQQSHSHPTAIHQQAYQSQHQFQVRSAMLSEHQQAHHEVINHQTINTQLTQHNTEHDQYRIEQKGNIDLKIDHVGMSKYANFSLDVENDQNNEVYLRIIGNETRGSAISKYTAYIIKGHDKNGEIMIYRRFSQFHALRVAMVQRWPGCFIPSIPPKNVMHKNDKDETIKRERYLNDFVIKMTKLPHLYNSEQFQTFLRSKQTDTSKIYSAWSAPTGESIINKYQSSFHDLEGKQIDTTTNVNILQFYARIKKNAQILEKYRLAAKNLALSYDRWQKCYPRLFTKVIPNYEKFMLYQYSNGTETQLVYQNTEEAKLNQHAAVIAETTFRNPYWSLYDLIKHEERDGRAFLEALQARQSIQQKINSTEGKIKDNGIAILELNEGKTNLKSMMMKGTKQEIKYKLEVQNEELKKEKNTLFSLLDIISALVVYIQIPAYEEAKINFYNNTLKKIGGFELNSLQIQIDVWKDVIKAAVKVGEKASHQK